MLLGRGIAKAAAPPGCAAASTACACRATRATTNDQGTQAEPQSYSQRGPPTTATAAATSATATAAATNKPDTATPEAAASSAATASATSTPSDLHIAAANVFPVEEMERGETDIGHFLFAKDKASIGRRVLGLRSIGSGDGGCGCAAHERKAQPGSTQHLCSRNLGCAFALRSLFNLTHGGDPPNVHAKNA
jgi:hypothetical protein